MPTPDCGNYYYYLVYYKYYYYNYYCYYYDYCFYRYCRDPTSSTRNTTVLHGIRFIQITLFYTYSQCSTEDTGLLVEPWS